MDDETCPLYQNRADAAETSVEEWASARLAYMLPEPIFESKQEDIRQQMYDRFELLGLRDPGGGSSVRL